MQKKPSHQEQNQASNSDWQNNLKKQQRNEMLRKVAIWGGIVIACVAGLALLVKMAGMSGPPTTPVENTRVKAVSADKDIIMGNPAAKVTIIEYADFQCPACASYNPIVNQLLSEYDGRIKVVYRFFPLTSIHKNAKISGQAGYAAWKLGKFHEMKDELYSNQKDWENIGDPEKTFVEYAASIGLDRAKFTELMNSKEAQDAVSAGEAEAINIGLSSTPSFFIGNRQFTPSGYEAFKTLIDEELKASGQQPTTRPLQ